MTDSESVAIQVELLPEDFRAFSQYVIWHRFRASHLRNLFFVPVLILAVLVVMANIGDPSSMSILVMSAYAGVLVGIWLLWALSLPRQHAKMLEKQVDRTASTLTFSQLGVDEEGPGFRRHMDWSLFSHVVRFRQLLLLIHASDKSMVRAEMIPCRALGDSEAGQAFERHLAALLSAGHSGS